jgi:hypothetical protein
MVCAKVVELDDERHPNVLTRGQGDHPSERGPRSPSVALDARLLRTRSADGSECG